MFKGSALRLGILGLLTAVCGQEILLKNITGVSDDSHELVPSDTSDDASLLQVSRTQLPLQSPKTSAKFDPIRYLDWSIYIPNPLIATVENSCLPFSGCFRFWRCLGKAFTLAAPLSLLCSLTLILLATRVCPERQPEIKTIKDASEPLPQGAAPPMEAGEACPRTLRWLTEACNVMMNVNFTIMMPVSAELTEDKSNGLALSGFVIGSYAIGTILAIPLFIHFSVHSYKTGYLVTALAGVLGNLLWCYATTPGSHQSVDLLPLARIICGFEGAVAVMITNITAACATGLARVQFLSTLAMSGCLGLLLGPSLASLSGQLFGADRAPFFSASLMTCVALVFGIAVIVACPSRESAIKFHPERVAKPVEERVAWLGIFFVCAAYFIRAFQRVLWEAAFLYIVAEGYKFGVVASGYLTALPLLLLMLLPFVGKPLCQYFGQCGYILLMDCMQIGGMCLMFHLRVPALATTFRATVFIFGSAMFYFANWAQIVAVSPFQAIFQLPHHPVLNMETIPALTWGMSFVGYFFGPIVSRMLIQACPNQDILPSALLISCGLLMIGQQFALEKLRPFIPK